MADDEDFQFICSFVIILNITTSVVAIDCTTKYHMIINKSHDVIFFFTDH
jgi:hypothetical protein